MQYKHIFGPVPSRRLGISLGVDLLPYKTCSFNCIYCESGITTSFTMERSEFFPMEDILSEITHYMDNSTNPDYITFSGSGEPTLYSKLGTLINEIKKRYETQKIAILTNSSLFFREDVRSDCLKADIILPSLDSARIESYKKIDRPIKSLELTSIINGLLEFSKIYKGQIWLEVFFALGINDNPEDIQALYEVIKKIRPAKVQLNTVDRPPAESNVKSVSKEFLFSVINQWRDLPVEIISRFTFRSEIPLYKQDFEERLITTLIRRPLTKDDIIKTFGISEHELNRYLDILEKEKRIITKIQDRKIFFIVP